jgi:epoxyqueuosine reductase
MLDSKTVKQIAKDLGADLVGIAPMSRFEGAPKQMDPRYIMPNAKSMIVVANRINRGALRGIEEGTHFSSYSAMGYGAINTVYLPNFVIRFARIFEDEGYEAIPFGFESVFGNSVDSWTMAEEGKDPPLMRDMLWAKPVSPVKPAPDVLIHVRIAAYLAGLGEIGYSKVFLTPEFGPRQRFGMILTEMELEPDPIYDGPPLCNRCMACVRECPGAAINPHKTVKVTLAGHDIEWGEIDPEKCLWAFRGAEQVKEGEKGHYIAGSDKYKPSPITPFYKKPSNTYTHGEAICGGRGCIRACMIGLEERGVLKNKFKSPFRTEKPWLVDWSDYDINDPRAK